MKGDLFINGKDAFEIWGVNMNEGFLNNLLTPPPAKGYVENKSRLENGKQIVFDNEKEDEREISLVFTIKGTSQSDYLSKFRAFMAEMSTGLVAVNVPVIGSEKFRVYYKNSVSFAISVDRTFSKIAIKVFEPDPSNRG